MRRTPINRKSRIVRKTRLARVSAKRLRELREYAMLRRAVLRAAAGKCSRCSALRKLDVHHIERRSRSGLFGPCVALCRRCHDEIHFGRPADRDRWLG